MSDKAIDATAQKQARAWQASADRAELRGQSALATIFRNVAYELQYGSLTLTADIEVKESETASV